MSDGRRREPQLAGRSSEEKSAETILILGASVRAAAMSAVRAGLQPFGIDLFADRDLQRLGPTIRVDPADYPNGLFAAADRAPPGPWMYTGGLENYPDLIDALAAKRPLWGSTGAVLRRVRDPFLLHKTLTAVGFAMAEVRASPDGLPIDGSWLIKPIRSGGGRGIGLWGGQRVPAEPHVFQKLVVGEPLSAVYCGNGTDAVPLGITRQLVGDWRFHTPEPFSYCGSIGPVRPKAAALLKFRRLGQFLAAEFGLVGLFGVDAVVDDAAVTLIEVNSRYTASIEVLEFAGGPAAVTLHGIGCARGELSLPPAKDGGYVAKGVLYAPRETTAPDIVGWDVAPGTMPATADVPQVGSVSPAGFPVVSLLVRGPDVSGAAWWLDVEARVMSGRLWPEFGDCDNSGEAAE